MRLAKTSQTLLTLAASAVLATCALAQDQPNVQPKAVQNQVAQQAPAKPQAPATPNAPAPAPAKPMAPVAAKAPAKPAAKAATPAPAKAPAPAPAKAPEAAKEPVKTASAAPAPAAPPVEKPAEEKPVVRRDPFDTLLTKARTGGNATPENLPPGKAGLVVETLRIDGIVHSPNGMIAIVSNSQQRVYFLREGDKLYDGSVEKIALDAISFHEIGKDAFGKPLERTVSKRLYPSSGEQQ
jgi:Tfp pilus assembly protein PilP